MKRIVLFLSLALGLAACASDQAQSEQCARERPAGARLAWGYFPGYGCGPVPRAVTNFSAATPLDRAG